MIKTDVFSLEKLPKNYLFALDRCRLVLNGQPQPSLLHGEQIDLQMAFGEHTLLATSYDYFDGCQHWLYLVGGNGRIVDGIRMPDEFGFLQDLTTVSEDRIAFGYFGTNDRWNLRVHKSGFRCNSIAVAIKRPIHLLFSKRYLSISRLKGDPWTLQKKVE